MGSVILPCCDVADEDPLVVTFPSKSELYNAARTEPSDSSESDSDMSDLQERLSKISGRPSSSTSRVDDLNLANV